MMNTIPKIIRLEKQYTGIISCTDKLLSEGLSYRVIALKLRQKFSCSISHESIRIYDHYKTNGVLSINQPKQYCYFVIKSMKGTRY
jgi:hypothetical protein